MGALFSRVDLAGLAGLEETLTLPLVGEGNGAKSGALQGVECVYGKVPGALRSLRKAKMALGMPHSLSHL